MTITITKKLISLHEMIEDRYRAANDPHPDLAAKFQMDIVINMVRGQEQYAEQLIDEEIAAELKSK